MAQNVRKRTRAAAAKAPKAASILCLAPRVAFFRNQETTCLDFVICVVYGLVCARHEDIRTRGVHVVRWVNWRCCKTPENLTHGGPDEARVFYWFGHARRVLRDGSRHRQRKSLTTWPMRHHDLEAACPD